MIITCEKCRTGYELDSAAISATGRMVKCSTCEHIWRQFPPEGDLRKKPLTENVAEPEFKRKIQENARVPVAMAQSSQPGGLFAKLLFAVLLLLNLTAASFIFGEQILLGLPSMHKIERHLRAYTSRGVEFQNLTYQKQITEDKATLLLNGEIVNTSGETRKTPKIMISFMDKDGKKILAREYPADKKYMKTGQKIPFEPKISDIPLNKVAEIYLDIGSGPELFFR